MIREVIDRATVEVAADRRRKVLVMADEKRVMMEFVGLSTTFCFYEDALEFEISDSLEGPFSLGEVTVTFVTVNSS